MLPVDHKEARFFRYIEMAVNRFEFVLVSRKHNRVGEGSALIKNGISNLTCSILAYESLKTFDRILNTPRRGRSLKEPRSRHDAMINLSRFILDLETFDLNKNRFGHNVMREKI